MTRFLHTVRYLKPVQVYGRVYRSKPRVVASGSTPQIPRIAGPWIPGIAREDPRTGPNQFRFLNQERRIETWNDSGIPKLWLYNLHYFDSPAAGLVQEWIAANPVGQGNGWEPYPLSLRICNWIKWHLSGNLLGQPALESLALQAGYLARTVEYHLLGNHLLANAKALVFAGSFFEGAQAAGWLASGLRILAAQIPEQILLDGGHFERSPMYHCIILEDLLDLIGLARAYPGLLPDWSEPAARMLSWLRQMTHPDGRISFFNDATFGVAPEPRAIFEYAARLGLTASSSGLGESGYIRLQQASTVILFDAALIGPDYQPGHAHADTLSFEMSHAGKRLIVNSGTSTYEPGPERLRQRGTAAHSTVTVDGADQSEIWSAFRVARRARPFEISTDRASFAEAAHDGYHRLPGRVTHQRRLQLSPGRLLVTDTLLGRGAHEIEVRLHLHPGARPEIRLDPRLVREDRPGAYHPGFNQSVPCRSVVGTWRGPLPVIFETSVTE
jgi:uncharacterized heparinase superfamily protein